MKEYIDSLTLEFEKSQNSEIALRQKAYMRDKFEYYGLKTTLRRVVQKPFLNKAYLPPKKELDTGGNKLSPGNQGILYKQSYWMGVARIQ